MSKTSDLMGVGFSAPQAQNLGYSSVAITAAGTTSADATGCDAQNSYFIMTATGSEGIRMNAAVPLLRPIIVVNTSGSADVVYPATGGAISGGSTDAGISVGAHKSAIIMRSSTTAWMLNLSA